MLRAEFPDFWIWREDICGRVRFIARSRRTSKHPHTVVTADPAELRAALKPSQRAGLIPFSTHTASMARVYDLLLGGKGHYPADRAVASTILDDFPEISGIARDNRAFQGRAVRYAASQGIRQFIDLGVGLPAMPNTHQSARPLQPTARVAYVDCDELVLARARAMLAADRDIAVVAGNIRDPGTILGDPALTSLIDLAEPVCVLLTAVLHFLPAADADNTVAAFRDEMPPGSYLVISAGTSTGTDPELIARLQAGYEATAQVTARDEADIAAWFDGLILVTPGLTDVRDWRADTPLRVARPQGSRARFVAGVASKPTSPCRERRHSHDRHQPPAVRRRSGRCR